ncbi:MAG: BatA domain-containing protein [Thermaurantimonas sp.]
MNFGNPLFLWSLLLISIPIILHLFRLRKYKKIVFTQTFFFEQTQAKEKRIKNLKKILILSARILTLSFLIAAFSLPFLSARNELSSTHRENKNIVLYIDNHPGFFFTDETGENRWSRLTADAIKLIDRLGSFKRISILTNTSESEHFFRKEDAIRFIQTLKPQLIIPDWNDISLKIIKHTKNESEKPIIILLSDFVKRKDDIRAIEPLFIPFLAKPFSLKNIPIIDSLWREPGSDQYQASVLHHELNPTFVLGSQKRTLFTLRSKDFEKGILRFSLPPSIEESHLYLEPESNNNPILKFYFSTEKGGRQKLLVLTESENVSDVLKQKFSRMQTADVDYVDVHKFNPQEIQNYSSVILLNVREISDKVGVRLHSVLQQNGRVLIFPPEDADLFSYNRFLQRYDSKFRPAETGLIQADKIEYRDMLFEGAFKNEIDFPDLPYFSQIYPLESRTYRKVLYTLSDKVILANVQTKSAGYLYVFLCPIDPQHSNLVFHTIFNPLMYNFINNILTNQRLYHYAGSESVFIFTPESMLQDEQIKILTPSGEEQIPYQIRKGRDILVYFGRELNQNGLYTFTYLGNKLRQVSFNADVRHVLQSTYTSEELSEALSMDSQSIVLDTDLDKFSTFLGMKGTELWYPLILLAVIFYISELLVIRFF